MNGPFIDLGGSPPPETASGNGEKRPLTAGCAMRDRESPVLRACLDYLRLRGVVCWRQNAGAFATLDGKRFMRTADITGIADIIGLLPDGRFLAVECKSGAGRQSQAQRDFQADVERNNGRYILARSVDDVMKALA